MINENILEKTKNYNSNISKLSNTKRDGCVSDEFINFEVKHAMQVRCPATGSPS